MERVKDEVKGGLVSNLTELTAGHLVGVVNNITPGGLHREVTVLLYHVMACVQRAVALLVRAFLAGRGGRRWRRRSRRGMPVRGRHHHLVVARGFRCGGRRRGGRRQLHSVRRSHQTRGRGHGRHRRTQVEVVLRGWGRGPRLKECIAASVIAVGGRRFYSGERRAGTRRQRSVLLGFHFVL